MAEAKSDSKSEAKAEAKSKAKANARTARMTWELVHRVLASPSVRHVYLYGPPGVGKSYCAIQSGARGGVAYSITLTQEMPASELRGHWVPRGNEFVWMDGPVVRAMREGALVVLNELLHASEDALAFLYPVLEMPETARVTLPTSETIVPAPGFRVIVTDNHPPTELPAALRDRFDVVLEIETPHPDALAALPRLLREAAERSFTLEEDRRLSVRPFLFLARLWKEFGLEDACTIVFGPQRGSQIFDALVLAGALEEMA
jgi:MoxR-like ATPase